MRILGQHGELWEEETKLSAKRKIEIEEGERLEIWVVQDGKKADIIDFFVPGVLAVEWERGARLWKVIAV